MYRSKAKPSRMPGKSSAMYPRREHREDPNASSQRCFCSERYARRRPIPRNRRKDWSPRSGRSEATVQEWRAWGGTTPAFSTRSRPTKRCRCRKALPGPRRSPARRWLIVSGARTDQPPFQCLGSGRRQQKAGREANTQTSIRLAARLIAFPDPFRNTDTSSSWLSCNGP